MKQKKEEADQKAKEQTTKKLLNERTEKIAEKNKTKQIKNLFQSLDQDQDGVIHTSTLTQENIGEQKVKALQGFLSQYQEQEMDQNTFTENFSQYLNKLSQYDKNLILERQWNYPSKPPQFEFHPSINKDSKDPNRQHRSTQKLISELYQFKDKVKNKLEEKAGEKEQLEVKDCTFAPEIRKIPDWFAQRKSEIQQKASEKQQETSQNPIPQEGETQEGS